MNAKRRVYIKVSFLKIEDIDVVLGRFTADIFYQARWRELSLDHSKAKAEIKFDSYWNPGIYLDNVVTQKSHAKWNVLDADEKGAAYIIEKHRQRATFYTDMNLKTYPFDIQSLPVTVKSKLSAENVEFLEEDIKLSKVYSDTFPRYHEWSLKPCVEFIPGSTSTDDIFSTTKNPLVEVKCFARRRPGFFFWNVFLIMTLNTLLSFSVFTVDRELPDFRIRLGFILLLSGVTFKFTISRFVPGIPYLTQLDKYVIGNSFFVALTCVWHAAVTITINGVSMGAEEDKWAIVAFVIGYVLLQFLYIINVIISGYKTWSHLKQVEEKYKEKHDNLYTERKENTKTDNKMLRRRITQKKFGAWKR